MNAISRGSLFFGVMYLLCAAGAVMAEGEGEVKAGKQLFSEKDYDGAYAEWKVAADLGNAEAMYHASTQPALSCPSV